MKQIFKLLLGFSGFIFFYSVSFSWTYPLKEVSKPTATCKFSPWNTLGANCKIPLPVLKPSQYKKYLSNLTYRRIYTVLWGGSYKYGWDQGYGSHQGVDIATSLGTPVYSIGNGKVVFAGWKKGRGKVVVIQYKVGNKYIYANYAHLNKIFVKFGQYVKEGQKIGEVGHTGFSIGNHLHFQIDLNQSISQHPWWFGKCAYGKSIMDIVNNNYCFNELKSYTIDPLAFLSNGGAILNIVERKKYKPVKLSRKNMISYEEIRRQMIKEFLRTHKFYFNFPNAGVFYLGKYGKFTITLKDKRGRNFKDILPGDLNIIYDKKYFSAFYPRTLKVLDGTRKITFLPKKTGTVFLTFKLGDFVIYQKAIRIVKPGQVFTPFVGDIITVPYRKYISYPAWGINIFKDRNYINLINVPFKGTYYLTSTTKDIYFCKAPTNIKYLNFFHCSPTNIVKVLPFTYKDTVFGLLVFKFFSNTGKPTQLVIKDSKGKIISKSSKIYFNKIKLTNYNTPYKNYIYEACKYGLCLGLIDKGYIWSDRNLSVYQAKRLIQNFLYLFGKKINFKYPSSEKFKTITRLEFVKFVLNTLGVKIKDYTQPSHYIDIKSLPMKDRKYIIYLEKLGFSWKDRFAKYHFQPNKPINVGESLYFMMFLYDKLTRG